MNIYTRRNDAIILIVLVVIYLWFFFTDIYGPGLAYEELDEAVYTVNLLHNRPAGASYAIPFGKTDLPLTAAAPYIGAIQTYLLLPFFTIFGVNVFALRFMSIVFGIGTILLTFFSLKKLFNRPVAFLTIFFLVFQPSFLLFTKMGNSDSILNLFFMVLLLLFTEFRATKKSKYLYFFAFIAGIGVWTKIVFIWPVLGFFVSWLFIYRRQMQVSLKQLLFSLVLFGAGVAPLVYANFSLGGGAIKRVMVALRGPYFYSGGTYINNYEFIKNFFIRIHQFIGIYSGYDFDVFDPYGSLKIITIFPFIFLCAIIFLSLKALRSKKQLYWKNTMFILLMFVIVFLGLCFTISIFRSKHLFLLVPLPQIILSLFIVFLFNTLRRFSLVIPYVISVFLSGAIILPNLSIINWYRSKNFVVSKLENSLVTYEMVKAMIHRGINTVYIVDEFHRIGRKVSFLSHEKIVVHELIRDGVVTLPPNEFYLLTFPVKSVGDISGLNYAAWDYFIQHHPLKISPLGVGIDSADRPVYLLSKVSPRFQ